MTLFLFILGAVLTFAAVLPAALEAAETSSDGAHPAAPRIAAVLTAALAAAVWPLVLVALAGLVVVVLVTGAGRRG